ncbi:MAG TPA: DUF447 domain-containing protein [Pseudolabrys sp.]|nr:DUF447 domain-containing protein [Pseudolabrys sp.]
MTTADSGGRIHVAPLGLIAEEDDWIIAPFRPSVTLDNLLQVPFATASYMDDVRIFAGLLTGRKGWATTASENVPVPRLSEALSHTELAVTEIEEDPERPRLRCRVVRLVSHKPFQGFNRAQAAVLEAAILVSRLHLLPREKVERELAYLGIAVDKTAGPRETEAWGWLMDKVRRHFSS